MRVWRILGVCLFVCGFYLRAVAVSRAAYLDVMAAAVGAYPEEHILAYTAAAEQQGVQEHGFPRLTANIGMLLANDRLTEKRDLFVRMMTIACRDAAKGPMPPKSGGNEFSVKELVYALVALEKRGTFPRALTQAWRDTLCTIDARRSYTMGRLKTGLDLPRNWVVFACASEQARLAANLGGDPAFVETYVADQLRWFDEMGMYRDPNQPAVYDFVTRLQFANILADGYAGPSRARLEALMDLSAEPTLKMLSAAGEIPYGGRSNQFLHNNTFYAALCAWYAQRAVRRGDLAQAARFETAITRSLDALKFWLAQTPVSHVKNRYPRESGKGVFAEVADMGCERYAYFDKYMITMGSWAMNALHFPVPELAASGTRLFPGPYTFATTPDFHWVFLSAGDYSAQFDYAANPAYDAVGLGRLHRLGAPTALALSTPCPLSSHYRRDVEGPALAIVPVMNAGETLCVTRRWADAAGARVWWRAGKLVWRCCLSEEGLCSQLSGAAHVALALPAFRFDGAVETRVTCSAHELKVAYQGWVFRAFTADGEIVATDGLTSNRNGRYQRYEARGCKSLKVLLTLTKDDGHCDGQG